MQILNQKAQTAQEKFVAKELETWKVIVVTSDGEKLLERKSLQADHSQTT